MSIVLQAGLFGAGVAVGAFAAVQASRPAPPPTAGSSSTSRVDGGAAGITALETRVTNQLFSFGNPGKLDVHPLDVGIRRSHACRASTSYSGWILEMLRTNQDAAAASHTPWISSSLNAP